MTSTAIPNQWVCLKCFTKWDVAIGTICPSCEVQTDGFTTESVWDIAQVGNLPVWLSGNMGSHERFLQILSMGFDHIVDIADNAHDEPKFTWRPDHYPVRHTHIKDFFDYGDPIPDSVFDTVAGAVFYALSVTGSKMLFHCSAGIRRSPNIMWGVLLGLGFSEVHAWRLIIEARPYAQAVLAYQNSAREWARRKR